LKQFLIIFSCACEEYDLETKGRERERERRGSGEMKDDRRTGVRKK
jgi:hypothetical protein